MKKVKLPLSADAIRDMKVGDQVLLSGVIYTARDAGHKRICETLVNEKKIAFPLEGATIYYVGPTPKKEGCIIGSAGPTTSGRMDAYSPILMKHGLKGMIGKGTRSPEVIEAMVKFGCVYFAVIGGAGALLSKTIKESKLLDYEDLGSEALRQLIVEDMQAVVAIDSRGNNIYKIGRQHYLEQVRSAESETTE